MMDCKYSLGSSVLKPALDNVRLSGIILAAVLIVAIVHTLRVIYQPGLRMLPGNWLASFSRLYKIFLVYDGRCPEKERAMHKKYGPVVRTGPYHVSFSDPAAIPTIYGIAPNFVKSDFYIPFGARHGKAFNTIFSTRDTAFHKHLKVHVSQIFSLGSIRTLEPMVDECSDIFMRTMHQLAGEKVDLGAWLHWYAFDVIGAITFNKRFGFMEQREDIGHMIAVIDKVLMYGTVIGQVPYLHAYLLGNDYVPAMIAKLAPHIPNPIVSIIEFAKAEFIHYDQSNNVSKRGDFLAWIRREMAKGKDISEDDTVNHLANNLLAGGDTTAISLRAIIYFLIKNPHAYGKVMAEIDAADTTGQLSKFITYGESLELKYLQAAMREAMRLNPGVSMPLERVVPSTGATICDVTLPAGTVVGVNPAVVHHDTDIYGADAAEFRPERWLESSEEQLKAMNRSFLAFGHGSRACIGKNISMMELGKLILQLMREFEIEWASEEPTWKVFTYFFARQEGMIVRLKSRRARMAG